MTTRLRSQPTALEGLFVIERQGLRDERGAFTRMFCQQELAGSGWIGPVAQINHSLTRHRGTVRGLHYQRSPCAEIKLVSCLRGEVWDVAVDLRPASPTFLRWHAQRLSAANGLALLIPQGFAHGFQALSDDAELLYCHSEAYAPAAEAGLHPQDARLAIDWPLPVAGLSPRDARHAPIGQDFAGVPA